jgi:outer membrane protein TolC
MQHSTGNPGRLGLVLCLATGLVTTTSLRAGASLSITEAERLALRDDPAVVAAESRAAALRDQAVAEGQLPDPKLGVGVYNLPLDDFSIRREPSTQFRTRIEQTFPRGDTLQYHQQMTEWMSESESAQARLTRAEIRRDVRLAFLELYYQQQAAGIVEQSRGLFQQLVEITRAHFASGRVSQQDVLQAELEVSRLDDRATRIEGEIEEQRARLGRWLGRRAQAPVEISFPALPGLPAQATISKALPRHPVIKMQNARVEANLQQVKAAREQYKPGWNVGIEYRKRFGDDPDGSERADMMAAMLTVDLPLFTGKRQDRRFAASQYNAQAAQQVRQQRLRELRRELDQHYARWERLNAQQQLYQQRLLREAAASAEAALRAYQSGLSEFTTLVQARIVELDVRLQDMRIRVDRAATQVQLLFLATAREESQP